MSSHLISETIQINTDTVAKSAFNKNVDPFGCDVCRKYGRVNTSFSGDRFHTMKKIITAEKPIDSLRKVLENLTIWELTEQWRRQPVVIYAGQNIGEALLLISRFRIFSLPVLNEMDYMIGLIDVMDIVKELEEQGAYYLGNYDENKVKQFFETKIDSLFLLQIDKKRSKSFVISSNATTISAIRNMVLHRKERFIIVDRNVPGDVDEQPYPEKFFQGVVSATDILSFLCKFPTWIKKEQFFQKPINELIKDFKKPKIVNYKESTIKVFMEIGFKGFKGVAIVDDDGKLISNLSLSDIKGITLDNSYILNAPLQQFLECDNSRGWWAQPLCVEPTSTLYEIIQQFVCTRVHRLYIVDDNGKPIGVINHRDILQQILWFMTPISGDQKDVYPSFSLDQKDKKENQPQKDENQKDENQKDENQKDENQKDENQNDMMKNSDVWVPQS